MKSVQRVWLHFLGQHYEGSDVIGVYADLAAFRARYPELNQISDEQIYSNMFRTTTLGDYELFNPYEVYDGIKREQKD